MCGLKLDGEGKVSDLLDVTPFVGVWIETLPEQCEYFQQSVTPFVGVWIETTIIPQLERLEPVTPFVGVWIETL